MILSHRVVYLGGPWNTPGHREFEWDVVWKPRVMTTMFLIRTTYATPIGLDRRLDLPPYSNKNTCTVAVSVYRQVRVRVSQAGVPPDATPWTCSVYGAGYSPKRATGKYDMQRYIHKFLVGSLSWAMVNAAHETQYSTHSGCKLRNGCTRTFLGFVSHLRGEIYHITTPVSDSVRLTRPP